MEGLIKQSFVHVDILSPHVDEGHYDLVGPDGEIILPQVWESMVQPGWAITMHMWPMPKPPLPSLMVVRLSKFKSFFKRKKRIEEFPFPRQAAGGSPRSQRFKSNESSASTISRTSGNSIFSQTSELSSYSESSCNSPSTLPICTYDVINSKCSSNPHNFGDSRMQEIENGNSEPPPHETTNGLSASGNPGLEPNDAEPSEEEFLSRPSSITSVPSQNASSRTSISQNSSGEDTSSQSSSSFTSSTQDSSSLASLDSDSEPSTEEFLLDSLSSSKSRFIDKLMKEFHVTFSSALDLRTCAETQSGSSNNTTAATQPSTLQPRERGAAKGPSTEHRGWRKDEGGGDQDDDDAQRRRKKANKPPDADQAPNVRFACPFFKHNPRQHKGRACRYPGFKGVHRMKYDLSKSLTIATNAPPGNIFIGAMSRFIATDATTSFGQKMNCKIIKGCPSLARST